MRTIKFKKGRRSPRLLDSLWVKSYFLRAYILRKNVRMTIYTSKESLYTVESVGGDRDEKDWLKMGGTMTIGNIIKKQRETLVGFRRFFNSETNEWERAFESCEYLRPKNPDGTGHYQRNIEKNPIWEPLDITIPASYPVPVGPWAGGDFILLDDFEVRMDIKLVKKQRPIWKRTERTITKLTRQFAC